MTYAFYNQFYLSNNLVLQPDTEAATTDQVVPLVKSGLGLGYVPQNFAKDTSPAAKASWAKFGGMCRRIWRMTPWPRGMCLPSS